MRFMRENLSLDKRFVEIKIFHYLLLCMCVCVYATEIVAESY